MNFTGVWGPMKRNWLIFGLIFVMLVVLVACAGSQRTRRGGRAGGGGRTYGGGGGKAVVENLAPGRYTVNVDNHEVSTPMMANKIERGSADITRAIFVIPAVGRNVGGQFHKFNRLAQEKGMENETLIVGMQFLYAQDVRAYEVDDNVLYWDEHGWSAGDLSTIESDLPRPVQISSFTILDSAVAQVIDEFPNVNTIIVTGNSAGSKFTSRYAAGTRMPEQHPDINFGFISSNGGTFIYMTPERPQEGSIDSWFTPNEADCEKYNDYPMGLEHLNEYQSQRGADDIRQTFATRNYVFFIGSLDTRPDQPYCAFMIQGPNRLERNKAYWNYLQYYYGPSIKDHFHFHIIEGAEHSGPTYDTEIGKFYLFDWVPGDASTYEYEDDM